MRGRTSADTRKLVGAQSPAHSALGSPAAGPEAGPEGAHGGAPHIPPEGVHHRAGAGQAIGVMHLSSDWPGSPAPVCKAASNHKRTPAGLKGRISVGFICAGIGTECHIIQWLTRCSAPREALRAFGG